MNLVKALRCTLKRHDSMIECVNCPYSEITEVSDNIPFDFKKNGKKYWISCNTEKILKEAADALEWKDPKEELPADENPMYLISVSGRVNNCVYDHAVMFGYMDEGQLHPEDVKCEGLEILAWKECPIYEDN